MTKRKNIYLPASMFLFLILFVLATPSCNNRESSTSLSNEYTAFKNPELVTITGFSDNAMELFISRDGNFLFFNNDSGSATDKDLFYATRVNDTTFQFQGAITAINSSKVDGVPTLDIANKFYYVSLVDYSPPTTNTTLYVGTWNGTAITGKSPLTSLTITTPLILYFDIEISPDGTTLYLSKGDFNGAIGFPVTADIVIAVDSGSGFALDPNSNIIMANVNTTDKLEYAPAISANGLELFFTRFNSITMDAKIYRAVRSNKSNAFDVPQLVSTIEGFVEGPAFSPDEKSLYYHRKNTSTGHFEIYRVTRP